MISDCQNFREQKIFANFRDRSGWNMGWWTTTCRGHTTLCSQVSCEIVCKHIVSIMILLQTWAARPLLTASVWRCWTSCRTPVSPVPCQRLEVRKVVQLITSTPTFLLWKCKLVFSYSRSTYNCAKWQYCITYLFSSIEVNLLKSHISFLSHWS